MTGLFAPWHLILILLLALLLFGAKRLPEIGRSLGGSMREFKDAIVSKDDLSLFSTGELDPPQPEQTPPSASTREHDTV